MRRVPGALFVCLLFAGTILSASTGQAEWARFRGPNLNGSVAASGAFGKDNVGLEVDWNRDLGSAYSGLVITDGRVVTMFSDGEFDYLVALDSSSGDEIWRYKIDTMYAGHDGSDDGPIGTPAIDGDTVFGFGPKGQLFAVSAADGSEIWSVKLDEKFEAKAPGYGFTTTPLVVGNVLFVQMGGSNGRSHGGFDKKTGKLLWSTGDDVVGYQSPIDAALLGQRQIVAVGNTKVLGLQPESGDVLWEHEYNTEDGDGSANPLVIGDDRVFLNGNRESVLIRVQKKGDTFEADEVWRTKSLKGSFASPVLHEEHLYGFDGNFLTCVDAASGEKVWKSRPPGGQGLILVDGHLLIFAPKGELVAAKATPDGYTEVARVQIAERGSYTWPSFAEGRIFVRNLAKIARIGISEAVASTDVALAREPATPFEAFATEVEASQNKLALIDDFMNAQTSLPIVDGELVTFIYRGAEEDVAITGSMTEFFVEEPMERIEGTDVWYKSYTIEPGARWEYRFNVDFENLQPDPANPRRVRGGQGDFSELLTGSYAPPSHLKAYLGDSPGTLKSLELKSEILENEREVTIYLPSGYDTGEQAFPLLIVTEGEEWLEQGNVSNSLNNLIGNSVSPIVVAFVRSVPQTARAEHGGPKSADYVRMLTDELIPRLETDYRLVEDPGSRAIMGYGGGAPVAVRAALERADVFGMSAVQSAYLAGDATPELLEMASKDGSDAVRFLVYWNRYELHNKQFNLDLTDDTTKLSEALKSGGYNVAGGEVLDAAGWGSWRARVGDILEDFFPIE